MNPIPALESAMLCNATSRLRLNFLYHCIPLLYCCIILPNRDLMNPKSAFESPMPCCNTSMLHHNFLYTCYNNLQLCLSILHLRYRVRNVSSNKTKRSRVHALFRTNVQIRHNSKTNRLSLFPKLFLHLPLL